MTIHAHDDHDIEHESDVLEVAAEHVQETRDALKRLLANDTVTEVDGAAVALRAAECELRRAQEYIADDAAAAGVREGRIA